MQIDYNRTQILDLCTGTFLPDLDAIHVEQFWMVHHCHGAFGVNGILLNGGRRHGTIRRKIDETSGSQLTGTDSVRRYWPLSVDLLEVVVPTKALDNVPPHTARVAIK